MIIYKVTNLVNNKVYIGQTHYTLEQRKKVHKNDSKKRKSLNLPFYNAINKYGIDNFKWENICICFTQEELDEMEFHYIKQYNSKTPNGYNVTMGGFGHFGEKLSIETRNKMSKSKIGVKNYMYGKYGNDNPNFGLKRTEKTKNKIRETKIGKNNPNYGKIFDEEYRRKLSESQIRRYRNSKSPLYGKIGKDNPNYGRKHSIEVIEKMKNCKKGINNPNYGNGKYTYIIINKNNDELIVKSLILWCKEQNINYDKIKYYSFIKNKFYKDFLVKRILKGK